MTLLYPSILWLMIPLLLLLWHRPRTLVTTVHLITLMLLLLTLSRPVQMKTHQATKVEAKDIIIAFDLSYSMRATDLNPTRYDFAIQTISALLEKSPADNIMLMAFTTNPLLLSPPTTDHTLIRVALQSLNPKFILTKGTSLKNLFKKLSAIKHGHKQLILITDGGEEKNLETLTTLLKETVLSLHVLALGTTQGATIQNRDGTWLKDKEGHLVVSRINPILERLTALVSGTYMTASATPTATAEKLYHTLEQVEKKQSVQKVQQGFREYYQTPLAIALILFLMVHTRAVKYLLLLFTLLGMQVEASVLEGYYLQAAYKSYKSGDYYHTKQYLKQIENPSLQSQILRANSDYKQGAFNQAIEIYKAIRSTSPKIKQQLYYNIANAYVMLADYHQAKQYYAKTLQLGEDADAQHNLHLIALLSNKSDTPLGIAHPKSQSTTSSKSEVDKSQSKETRSEEQPSSKSGGGESNKKEEQKKGRLLGSDKEEKHPLSSKVYELINRGYIHEKQPW